MLEHHDVVAMLCTSDAARARWFFEEVLSLTFVEDQPYALVFRANNAALRIAKVATVTPSTGTALGWSVPDIRAAVLALIAKGVAFERFPGMTQDELGVWYPAGAGAGVAWFKDPDDNLLSLSSGG